MSKLIIVEVPSYSCEFKGIREICELVRCGECKWRKAEMMPKSVKCLFSGNADDFCSYGERSSDETD